MVSMKTYHNQTRDKKLEYNKNIIDGHTQGKTEGLTDR